MSFESTALRFACADPELLRQRLRISRLTWVAGDDNAIEDAVTANARRRLTHDEWDSVKEHMLATPDTPPGATIELIGESYFTKAVSYFNYAGALALNTLILPPGSEPDDVIRTAANRFSTSFVNGNRKHLTPNMIHGKQVYMHVDNKFRLPVETRIHSPRRLGLNLGPGSRWLVFAVPDILTIAQELRLSRNEIPRTKHVVDYVRSRPLYDAVPCLWLQQRVGEAYVFPTELAPHDGSTIGERLDSTMAFFPWPYPVGTLSLSALGESLHVVSSGPLPLYPVGA